MTQTKFGKPNKDRKNEPDDGLFLYLEEAGWVRGHALALTAPAHNAFCLSGA